MTGPAYTDIHQQLGGIGDCWLMATLADAAYRNPSLIRNMFTSYGNYNENGLTVQIYGVHFYNTRGQDKIQSSLTTSSQQPPVTAPHTPESTATSGSH